MQPEEGNNEDENILGTVNLSQSTIYYAGLLGRWDKQIVDQESDVPCVILFILFIDLGTQNSLFLFL